MSIVAFLPLHWLGFHLVKVIAINFGIICSLLYIITSQEINSFQEFWKSPIQKVVLCYFALSVLYTIFSISPLASFYGASSQASSLIINASYLAIFILISSCFKRENLKDLCKIITLANGIVIIYGLLQILGLDPLSNLWLSEKFLNRTFSTIGNPNWLAAFVVMTLPIVYYYSLQKKKLYQVLIIMNLIVLASCSSKAGLVALIAMLTIWIFKNLFEKKFKLRYKELTIGFIGLLFIFASMFYFLQNRYNGGFELGRSLGARQVIWSSTIEAIQAKPLGYGLDTLQFIYPQFNQKELWEYESITATIDKAHNQILDILIMIGPAGLIVVLGFLLALIYQGLKKDLNQADFYLALSLLAYFISNLFGFDIFINNVIFWILIAILAQTNHSKIKVIDFKIISTILLMILISLSYIHIKHLRANFHYNKGFNALQAQDYYSAMNEFQESIRIYPYDRIYLLQAAELFLATANPQASQYSDLLLLINYYLEQVDQLSNGYDPALPSLEAWLATKQGDIDLFQRKLEESYQARPVNITTYKISHQIYKELGMTEEAQKELRQLESLLPSYWDKPETDAGRIFQKNNPWIIDLTKEVNYEYMDKNLTQ